MFCYNAIALVILCALGTHRWFKQHEPVISRSIFALLMTIPAPSAWLFSIQRNSYLEGISIAYTIYLTTLFTSIITYRLSPFHPLAKYPGPWGCRISQFAVIWNAWDGKLHQWHRRLHERYGPIVRVGPNELSVADKELLSSIIGTSGMPKGPIFEGRRMTPSDDKDIANFSLISSRDTQRHAVLRKAWNRAFGTSELKDYEELLLQRSQGFINKLENLCTQNADGAGYIDIAAWIGYFSFDFMGDIAFGGGFELVENGDKDSFCPNMNKALFYSAMCQHIPWFSRVLRKVPLIAEPMRAFGFFAFRQSKLRYGSEVKRKDLFYHLFENYEGGATAPFPLILSNSVLAIVAGADTTSSSLSNIIYYLLAHPTEYRRLREEIDAVLPPTQQCTINHDVLSSLPFLNAVINEVLRLQPPVATSLQRSPEAGSGGKLVGTHFIEEGISVQISPYVLHRSSQYFSPNPDAFWPERWLVHKQSQTVEQEKQGQEKPIQVQGHNGPEEVILDRSAYIPFSLGPANCVGKPLAMLELRIVTTLLVMYFEMEFEEGYDPRRWEEEQRQYVTLKVGKLRVSMKMRERKRVD